VIEVEVVGIRLELPANQPVLVLRDLDNSRYLPLWIGTSEATAISLALEEVLPPRPLTHDLLVEVIEHLEDQVLSASITELVDGVYYAQLEFANHGVVSARPSDAVAVAISVVSQFLFRLKFLMKLAWM
jgi:bifunctional DNase/RNase